MTFILLPLSLGVLQFGLVINAAHANQQIVREAGRWAAVHWRDPDFDKDKSNWQTPTQYDSKKDSNNQTYYLATSLHAYIKQACDRGTLKYSDIKAISVSPDKLVDRGQGQPITVTITYPMKKRSFIGETSFIPGLKKLFEDHTVSATFIME